MADVEFRKPEDYSDHKVRFVRHAGSSGPGSKEYVQKFLFDSDNPRIGIHFDNKASFNEDHYSSGGYMVRYLNNMADEPTLVVVSFSSKSKGEKYVAEVVGDSREVVVIDTKEERIAETASVETSEGRLQKLEDTYDEVLPDDDDRYKLFKTVQVSGWLAVAQHSSMPLWHWHSVQSVHGPSENASLKREYVRSVYTGAETPRKLLVLSNEQQELLVEKYLRYKVFDEKNFRLDAPRGGRLEAIDILGHADEEQIFASVTASSGSHEDERIAEINQYGQKGRAFFFGVGYDDDEDDDKGPDSLSEEVDYIALEEVFDWMNDAADHRRESLDVMLGAAD